jgi:hypothetical protein
MKTTTVRRRHGDDTNEWWDRCSCDCTFAMILLVCAKIVQNKNSDFHVLKHWSNLCQTLYVELTFGFIKPQKSDFKEKKFNFEASRTFSRTSTSDPSSTDVGPRFLKGAESLISLPGVSSPRFRNLDRGSLRSRRELVLSDNSIKDCTSFNVIRAQYTTGTAHSREHTARCGSDEIIFKNHGLPPPPTHTPIQTRATRAKQSWPHA